MGYHNIYIASETPELQLVHSRGEAMNEQTQEKPTSHAEFQLEHSRKGRTAGELSPRKLQLGHSPVGVQLRRVPRVLPLPIPSYKRKL